MSKGFWLPIELLKDKSTTMQEKLILVEINQLSMLDKGCIASNYHFAELLGIKKESVSRSISSLENKGYITTKIKDGSRNHERVITINKMLFSINELLFDPKQNVIDPLTNCLETKENKTINKTNNNKEALFNHHLFIKLNPTSKELYLEYVELRKKMKLVTSLKVHDRLLSKFFEFGEDNTVIENAINSNWRDFYKPKQQSKINTNDDDKEWSDGVTRCDPNEYR